MPQSSPMPWATLSIFPAIMLSFMGINSLSSETLMNKVSFSLKTSMKWTW